MRNKQQIFVLFFCFTQPSNHADIIPYFHYSWCNIDEPLFSLPVQHLLPILRQSLCKGIPKLKSVQIFALLTKAKLTFYHVAVCN